MTLKLFFQAITKFLIGFIVIGLIIFLSAGTINYLDGWVFMGLLFIPIIIIGILLMLKNPDLLMKRLNAKEKISSQSALIKLSGLMFIFGFVIAGLDFRFNWTTVPNWLNYSAIAVFILSYMVFGEVLRENTYLSRTIEVRDDQKVINTGLYSVVRHPMYTATIFLFLTMPLILGSLIVFFIFLHYPLITVIRILDEERFLEKELDGYIQYKKKVKYRLIPFIW